MCLCVCGVVMVQQTKYYYVCTGLDGDCSGAGASSFVSFYKQKRKNNNKV